MDWLGTEPEKPHVDIVPKPRKKHGHEFTKDNAQEMARRSVESRRAAIERGVQEGVNSVIKRFDETGKIVIPLSTTHEAITEVWKKFVELYMGSKDLRYMTEATRLINEAVGFTAKEPEHAAQGGLTLADSNVIFQIFNLDPNHPMSPQDVIDANFR